MERRRAETGVEEGGLDETGPMVMEPERSSNNFLSFVVNDMNSESTRSKGMWRTIGLDLAPTESESIKMRSDGAREGNLGASYAKKWRTNFEQPTAR